MKRLAKLIGLKRARRLVVGLLNAALDINVEFQRKVEKRNATNHRLYKKSINDCRNIKQAIELIQKEHSP